MTTVFRDFGVRIKLPEKEGADIKERTKDGFHVVKETLTRIGIASAKTSSLYQSCHILQKKGEFAILHFKELFALDGKMANVTDDDAGRRNTIVCLLEEWELLTIIDQEKVKASTVPLAQIKIISYADKKNWTLCAKYQIGGKK